MHIQSSINGFHHNSFWINETQIVTPHSRISFSFQHQLSNKSGSYETMVVITILMLWTLSGGNLTMTTIPLQNLLPEDSCSVTPCVNGHCVGSNICQCFPGFTVPDCSVPMNNCSQQRSNNRFKMIALLF